MEEELKKMLGENYHEGMTATEVQEYFNKTLLASGNYVNKEMADAEQKKLQKQLEEKENALKEKLSDEEKKALANAEKEKEIQELKELLAKNAISSNNYKALGLTAEARLNADIKDDDQDFAKFLNNIVSDDETKTTEISSYVNKIVKAAYEKGKADVTKQKMAGMGNFNKNENNNEDGDEKGIGTRLAKNNIGSISKENPYFKI